MTLVIPPGFGLAAYVFTGTTGTPEHVTTMGHDISAWGGDFVNCANNLMLEYGNRWAALTDSSLTLARVNLAVGQDGPGGSVDSDRPAIPMTASVSSMPVSMATILRKSTNDLGRRGRGRCFLPGTLTQAVVDENGLLSPARITAINTAAATWLENLELGVAGGVTAAPAVLLHSGPPTDPTVITGFSCAPVVGWIRGRIR